MSMIGNFLQVTNVELEAYLQNSASLENRIYNERSAFNLTGIDKAWDGICFLLTGTAIADAIEADHPLLKVLFSGQLIDENQDMGYGPAHYLTSEQVVEVNAEIATITESDLKEKYDPKRMTELGIYPDIWLEEGEEAFDYLKTYFKTVQQIYSDAVNNGNAIITFLN